MAVLKFLRTEKKYLITPKQRKAVTEYFAVGEKRHRERRLKITVPEETDYTVELDDIFKKYLKKFSLTKVKTVSLVSLYELTYTVIEKDAADEKRLIDEIRVRNGNLPVAAIPAYDGEEL